MIVVHRDYETRSAADLRKVGAHVYAQHPTTDVIVAVWIVERAGECEYPFIWHPGAPLPAEIVELLARPDVIVGGHNAAFEQAIDREIMGPRYGFPIVPNERVDCTLARCAIQAIPLDLERACHALNLKYQKDKDGHRLMLKMCKPRKPKKGECTEGWTGKKCPACNGYGEIDADRTRCDACGGTGDEYSNTLLLWHDSPAEVERLTEYCVADVWAEIGLGRALRPMTDSERRVWLLDQKMNNRGVMIDAEFVKTALAFTERYAVRLHNRMAEATGGAVQKTTQLDRLKDFLKAHGVELKTETRTRRNGEEYDAEIADKEAVEDLLQQADLPDAVRDALTIRLEAGKSSTKKLTKFSIQQCRDGAARGNLQYHAAQPGRWAGRGIQMQNLVRAGVTEPGGWEAAYRDLQELSDDMLELVYGAPIDLVSRMLRGAIVARPGKILRFADYSNVEGRGCVWAAGQDDQVQMFANDGKIYEEMAAYIFNMTVEDVVVGHKSGSNKIARFVGKEAVLGCGYGVGPDAFIRNCKKKGKIILPYETGFNAVHGWREKNWRVVEYWRELEDAAKAAIESPGKVFTAGPFSYRVKGKWLQCRLPSGRVLWYRRPTIEPKREDVEQCDTGDTVPRYRWAIHYWRLSQKTNQWEKVSTWGGKLLQNAIEGLCRDFLAGGIQRLEAHGYDMLLTVHDEAIAECDPDFGSDDEFKQIMTLLPPWAHGFPLKAEAGSGYRYSKA